MPFSTWLVKNLRAVFFVFSENPAVDKGVSSSPTCPNQTTTHMEEKEKGKEESLTLEEARAKIAEVNLQLQRQII